MATLIQNAAAVKAASTAIDAAIVAKGGSTAGGLTNAAAAISALPSGGDPYTGVAMEIDGVEYGLQSVQAVSTHNTQEPVISSNVEVKIHTPMISCGNWAFKDSSSLDKATFDHCLSLGFNSFWGSTIREIHSPKTIELGGYLFESCTNLEILDVPNARVFENQTLCIGNEHGSFKAAAFLGMLSKGYGFPKVYLTNSAFSNDAPWNRLPWGAPTDTWFYFSNGIVKYIDGAWTLTSE